MANQPNMKFTRKQIQTLSLCNRARTQTIHQRINNRQSKCHKTFRTQDTKHLLLPSR